VKNQYLKAGTNADQGGDLTSPGWQFPEGNFTSKGRNSDKISFQGKCDIINPILKLLDSRH